MQEFDIAIAGAGLAGSLSALALADSGRRVALIAPARQRGDGRTTALMDQSIAFLRELGLWQAVEPLAAPMETMQILDGTSRLFRAPPVSFRASEVSLDAFGYNIPNAPFLEILEKAIAGKEMISQINSGVRTLSLSGSAAALTLDNGETILAGLVVGADGRRSVIREQAGIRTRNWSYPQAALVLNFSHERPHANVSTEFHTESGPFTQVPLPGNRSSLVWVLPPQEAQEKAMLSAAALGEAVERRMQSMLGKVTIEEGPQIFPLSGMIADRFGKERVALIGEAAHALPPIGAQGLNLSLRDIMALRSLLPAGGAIPAALGENFDRRRQADVRSRTTSVDLLNRSLLSSFLPVQILRSAGLYLLSGIGPLRSIVMREGIEPGGSFKALRNSLRQRSARQRA
ncbi:MAG: UbiH/UbiF family hydroxylase [Shinella sp.]|nr:UbiH/UbiF family hydroxylase [Shinella sp.]